MPKIRMGIFLVFVSLTAFLFFLPRFSLIFAQVVINEVFYHGDNTKEWVELYNSGPDPVDVGGWTIEDNTSSDTLPSTTIPAGGFGVIVTNNTTVTGIAPEAITITLTTATIGNGLADSGDQVVLKNPSLVDQMSYGSNSSVFTLNGVAAGHSLERAPVGIDTGSTSDFIDQEAPAPGKGVSQVPTPTSVPTSTPTPTSKPTVTPSPTPTPKPTVTIKPTATPKPTPTSKPNPNTQGQELSLPANSTFLSKLSGEILGKEEEVGPSGEATISSEPLLTSFPTPTTAIEGGSGW